MEVSPSVSEVPPIGRLLEPALSALARQGGTCTNEEMHAAVVEALGLSPEQVRELHGTTSRTEVEYRLGWARTRLRQEGLIEVVEKKRWRLTDLGWDRARRG